VVIDYVGDLLRHRGKATATTALLGRWLKTAEVRDREMKPD
jgi:hypothetical protein